MTTEGRKFDQEKPRMGFLLKSFPNALRAAAKQNDFGAKKYDALNWHKVEVDRYEDSLSRHLVQALEAPDELDESGELHLAAVIWNACALFERRLQEKAKVASAPVKPVTEPKVISTILGYRGVASPQWKLPPLLTHFFRCSILAGASAADFISALRNAHPGKYFDFLTLHPDSWIEEAVFTGQPMWQNVNYQWKNFLCTNRSN